MDGRYVIIYIHSSCGVLKVLRMTTKFTKFIIYFLDLVEFKFILRTEIGEISMEDIVTRRRATSLNDM